MRHHYFLYGKRLKKVTSDQGSGSFIYYHNLSSGGDSNSLPFNINIFLCNWRLTRFPNVTLLKYRSSMDYCRQMHLCEYSVLDSRLVAAYFVYSLFDKSEGVNQPRLLHHPSSRRDQTPHAKRLMSTNLPTFPPVFHHLNSDFVPISDGNIGNGNEIINSL